MEMQGLFKYIIEEIKFIEDLSKTRRVVSKIGEEGKNFTGYFKKLKPKGFLLEVNSKDQLAPNIADEINGSLLGKWFDLKIMDAYLLAENFSYSKEPFYFQSQIHIKAFQKENFDKSHRGFYRNIIPIDSGMTFFFKVEDKTFRHDGGVRKRELVEIIVDSKTLHAYLVKVNTKSYLIVDCLNEITFFDFSEYYWSFTVTLGYITGYLAQNEVYTFCYKDQSLRCYSNFSYSQTRDTIVNRYSPVYTNPFAWIKSDKHVVGKFEDKLRKINSTQLSSLCEIIHHENDIKAIILLITEALKSSLLLMPAGLSVALEGLSEFFAVKNSSKLNPISDSTMSKNFRKELITVLEKYNNSHAFEGYEILRKKIMEINSPTNREKLKAPFVILKIALTKIDEEAIEHRNDFLHGNINLKPRRQKKVYTMDNNEISLRLITLLNMILMKMCGYNGYIVNYVKVQEWGMDKNINEEYFREI